jgi:hypothetical protein
MPISVLCQCGQRLKVSSQLVGRKVRCPKCQQPVAIVAEVAQSGGNPAARTLSDAKSASTRSAGAKPGRSKTSRPAPQPAALAGGGALLESLLEESGVQRREGRFCPNCDAQLGPRDVVCTDCGFDLTTGETLNGLNSQRAAEESYGHLALDDAVKRMRNEAEMDLRTLNVGMPWWALLCILLCCVLLAGTAAIIVDARNNGYQAEGSPIGELQRQDIGGLIFGVLALCNGLVLVFGHLGITGHAFGKSWKKGLASLLVPLYAPIYGFSQWLVLKSTLVAYLLAAVGTGVFGTLAAQRLSF